MYNEDEATAIRLMKRVNSVSGKLFDVRKLNRSIIRDASSLLGDRILQVTLSSALVVDCFENLVDCIKIGPPPETDAVLAEYQAELATRAANVNPSGQRPLGEEGEAEIELQLTGGEKSSARGSALDELEGSSAPLVSECDIPGCFALPPPQSPSQLPGRTSFRLFLVVH